MYEATEQTKRSKYCIQQRMYEMIYAETPRYALYAQLTHSHPYDVVLIMKISLIACASMVAFFFCLIHFCLTACMPLGL